MKTDPVKNINKFYVYAFLLWFTLWQPIIVIFWMENGVSLTQVFLIKSMHSLVMVLLETPTGAIADYLGSRLTLLTAALIYALSLLIYLLSQGFETILLAELIAGVGTALVSGTDSAFIYNSLDIEGHAERFTATMGRTRSIRLISQVIASLLGGLAASVSTRLTLALTLPPTLGGAAVAYSFTEPRAATERQQRHWLRILRDGFAFMRTTPAVRWFMLYTAGLAAIELCIFWLYQPYMQLTGLSSVYFGVAATLFHLTAAGSAYYAQPIQQGIGERNILIAMPLVLVAVTGLMSQLLSPFSFLLIVGLQVVRGIRTPILNKFFLDRAAKDLKATTISMVSLLTRLMFLVLSPGIGWLSDTQGIPSALLAVSLGTTVYFVLLAVRYPADMQGHVPVRPNLEA